MAAAPTTSADYKKTFDEVGYVIIPDLIPAESRAELEAATERVVAKTRSGEWPHRRVVGKVSSVSALPLFSHPSFPPPLSVWLPSQF